MCFFSVSIFFPTVLTCLPSRMPSTAEDTAEVAAPAKASPAPIPAAASNRLAGPPRKNTAPAASSPPATEKEGLSTTGKSPYLTCPLTARVTGAPRIISQPVSSIFLCSPLPSFANYRPVHSLMLSSHLF